MKYIFNGTSFINKREKNMDSILLKKIKVEFQDVLLGVVCDGVGGLAEGEYASIISINMLREWIETEYQIKNIEDRLKKKIEYINQYIVEYSKLNNIHTATTLSALLIVNKKFYIVHTGDSRIYSFENNNIHLITEDQVSESGRLISYIGKESNLSLKYYEGFLNNNIFIICSDGFHKKINESFLLENIKKIKKRITNKTINNLISFVVDLGERDNISLALIKIES